MKKLFSKVGIATFAIIVGAVAAYAWISVSSAVTYSGLSVRLKESDQSTIFISDSKTGGEQVKVKANSQMLEMSPCTTDDGKVFYDENDTEVKGDPYYLEKTFYIFSKVKGQQVHVDDVELSNGNQEITDALRVAVTVGNDTQIINPSENDYGTTLGGDLALSTTSPNVANVKVYFEGTDDACTGANIRDMDAIGVSLVLDAGEVE